ncbi:hypothetical protein ACFOWX_06590 [Sphingorhabdus arenilitoris]|uniref:Lipoprotein n=1 Tax=Sphingorhabdus arenilitoris TaxID=1490041 RepID=A0ABV8RHE0_9SPHN
MKTATIIAFALFSALLSQGCWAQPVSGEPEEPEMFDDNYTFVCPDGGYESGCERDDVERAVKLEPDNLAQISTHCLYQTRANCRVMASGNIAMRQPKRSLQWQQIELNPTDGPRAEMMIMAETGGPLPALLSSYQVDGYFDAPFAANMAYENMLIQIPGRNRGLGSADIFLYSTGDSWNWSSAYDIMTDVDKLLPKGFTMDSQIVFNMRELVAWAQVRRDDDPGCCVTGGKVYVDFELKDYSLSVSRIGFDETKPVGETRRFPADSDEVSTAGDGQ